MKPQIRIHDMATNEVIDREMTEAEYAEHQKQQIGRASCRERVYA
jgi:hypothetical protein